MVKLMVKGTNFRVWGLDRSVKGLEGLVPRVASPPARAACLAPPTFFDHLSRGDGSVRVQ